MASIFISNMFFFSLFFLLKTATSLDGNFTFNGFSNVNLTVDGAASITSKGLLGLTDRNTKGHAFYPIPLQFKSPGATKTNSFSTTFVFAIQSRISGLSGHGLAFIISGTTNFSSALPAQYLGLFNINNNGNTTNHVLAIELDTIQNPEFQDINDNHVGIDINSLNSNKSSVAGYYDDTTGLFRNLTLISGQLIQVWVDFDGESMQLNVTLSLAPTPKPVKPLVSSIIDLSSLMLNSMYVGFSASAGDPFQTNHYILGWSFSMKGVAGRLDYTNLPSLPILNPSAKSKVLAIWLPVALCSFMLLCIASVVLFVRRRLKYAELLEDWEQEYGPHRFSYKDLFRATKGFKEKGLLGTGGFGRVYKGILPGSKMEVAVKKVSHESDQGMRQFVAEIISIGQLRHRNLVQLLGYCRRKGELLLVYDFMPNGSLDRFLYDRTNPTLTWAQRFHIMKGVASGLLYLHEDWEQVVIHRDIKASNVLLDSELNGKLGDFGLARLYDRGSDPQTTHVVGTMGYLAPELAMMGKATTSTDVFAYGAFLLEVVCGKRPVERYAEGENVVLVDWVLENWREGSLVETMDARLREEYNAYEVELVLKLGLLCSHPAAESRPSMRQAMQILDGDAELSELLLSCLSISTPALRQNARFDQISNSLSGKQNVVDSFGAEMGLFSTGSSHTFSSKESCVIDC